MVQHHSILIHITSHFNTFHFSLQQLKLDAMVVQQGRLKEKDKLTAEELLDAIRFGADKIFKSKDSSITDDDVSAVLGFHVRFAVLACSGCILISQSYSVDRPDTRFWKEKDTGA
jgi:hypothetical protein